MDKKPGFFYRFNLILEIVLFTISVIFFNYVISINNWTYVIFVGIAIIVLEIFLKGEKYNLILRKAKKIEEKYLEFEVQGVTDIFFMRNSKSKNIRNQNIADAIDKANELCLLAETGKSYLDPATDRHWKHINNKLNEGKKIKILLINPFSQNKKNRNFLNGVDTDRKFDFSLINELNKNTNATVKFTNEVYCSLFFTDDYMVYDPYHLGKIADRIENNFLAIEFKKGNENYNILKSHFDNCWEGADSFDKIKKKYEKINPDI